TNCVDPNGRTSCRPPEKTGGREAPFRKSPKLLRKPFSIEAAHIPKPWHENDAGIAVRLSEEFNAILAEGIPALAEQELRAALRCLFNYVQIRSETSFVTRELASERELQ